MFTEDDLMCAYTRARAIDGGVLIDVSGTAREAGFRIPVALTRGVWERYVRVPEGVSGQDERGRLWDVVWMLRDAATRARWEASTILFAVLVRKDETRPKPVTLKAACGPDDDGKPCVTILLPEED